MVMLC